MEFKGLSILVVDDEEDLREILRDGFTLRGASVEVAADADEGIAQLRKKDFDLVISDVRMPKGGGLKILDEIPALGKAKPVIVFITGFSDVPEEEALRKGAKAVIAKPFDFATLYATVRKFIPR